MNPKENGNEPAHPATITQAQTGLTKRELFAAMMLQGLLSGNWTRDTADMHAKAAVGFADALLAELAKEV